MEREKISQPIHISKSEVLKLMPQFKNRPKELKIFYDIIKLFPKEDAKEIIRTMGLYP